MFQCQHLRRWIVNCKCSLCFHEKQPTFASVKSLWKRPSQYDQQTFSTGHQISPEMICPHCTLAHLTVLALMIILPQTIQSYVTKHGPGLSPADWNGFFPKTVPEVRWKQLQELWVKTSPLPCFPPLSPQEEEIQLRYRGVTSAYKKVVEAGVIKARQGN